MLPLGYVVGVGAIIPKWVAGLMSLLAFLLIGVLYLVVAVRTKILRWRVYFFTVLLVGAITVLLTLSVFFMERLLGPTFTLGRTLLSFVPDSRRILPGAVLLFVAVNDARQGRRYRWTHWLGVAIGLWHGVIGVVSAVQLATRLVLS